MACELYCCLLPQCEALRTCHSGFPIATISTKKKTKSKAFQLKKNLNYKTRCIFWAFEQLSSAFSRRFVVVQSEGKKVAHVGLQGKNNLTPKVLTILLAISTWNSVGSDFSKQRSTTSEWVFIFLSCFFWLSHHITELPGTVSSVMLCNFAYFM